MRSSILKHCSGRNYNSPFRQEDDPKKIEANVSIDKERKMLSPSLSASSGNLSANANANISTSGTGFNAGLNYNKGGFSAGIGVEGSNKSKPNVTASVGYKKTFR